MRIAHRIAGFGLVFGFVGVVALSGAARAQERDKKKAAAKAFAQQKLMQKGRFFEGRESQKPVAPPAPKSALLTPQAWQDAPRTALASGEIDRLIAKELQSDKIEPAPMTSDEQFLRRVTLDLTGTLPVPADVMIFTQSTDPQKRAKIIDKLLGTEQYARHWARFWRDVIGSRISDRRGLALANSFEEWLTAQLVENVGWDKIAKAMITAEGDCRFDGAGENGAAFFLAAHNGNDAVNERTAETARVFLGIQLQCAQCHDHPSDQWKQVQFHELAGYYSRVREQPMRTPDKPIPEGIRLVSLPRGEHEMPSKDDPKKTFITHPRFLDGKSPGSNLSDRERRKSLAAAVTDKGNYWFAGAFVNRVWGELMGQSFYMPVDDMGPQKEAVFSSVLTRLTGAFRGTDYDTRELFRAICNSETYQRQIRLGDTIDQHLHFAAAYPTRLRADSIWESLVTVLGSMSQPRAMQPRRPMGPYAMRPGLEGQLKAEFEFDPSTKPDEVEGSIPQALLLMNNPQLHQRIQARGSNLLARLLSAYPDDGDAVRMVYLRTLARKPTDAELARSREYVRTVEQRAEAFEDLLWALINSTEFQTKR